MERKLVSFEFSTAEIAGFDYSRFLASFGADTGGRGLREYFGGLTIVFDGYSHEEWLVLPGVRQFCRRLFKVWPYAGYFCDLRNYQFQSLVFGCMEQLDIINFEDAPHLLIHVDESQLLLILLELYSPLSALAESTGIQSQVPQRMREIWRYFNHQLTP